MIPVKFGFIKPCGLRGEKFLNQPIRNKNCLWLPCLLTDLEEMSNLYKVPYIEPPVKLGSNWPSGFRRVNENV